MAKCSECGKSAGFFTTLCSECEIKQEERKQQQRAKRLADETALEAEEAARTARRTSDRAQALCVRASRGDRVFLYETIYIPVDSKIDDKSISEFNIDRLRQLGLAGWEIVQVIPRTLAISLSNVNTLEGIPTGLKAYAGGIGGTVVGVHVLVRREVDPRHSASSSAAALAFAEKHPNLDFPDET